MIEIVRTQKSIPFEELEEGQFFESTDWQEKIFLKLPAIYRNDDDYMYNAVVVGDKEYDLSLFEELDKIIPIDVKITIQS